MDGAPSARDGAPHQCPFLSWLHSSIQFMLTTVAQFRWHHTTYIEGGGRTGENGERGDCVAYGGTQTEGGKNDRSAAAAYGSFGQGGTFIRENDGGGGGGGWYGGSGACYDNTPGGGGSSFYDKMESNAYRQMDQGVNDGEGYVVYRFL